MSYNSTTWQTGDTVTANKLNNIEQGIITLDTTLNELEDRMEGLEEGSSSGDSRVPANVKSALVSLFHAIPYDDDMTAEIAIMDSWASEISGISVSPSTASINGSSTTQLVATTTPAGGTVTWESSNMAVATVSNSGFVTGVGNGSATITARCGGYSAKCIVTVSGFAILTGITAVYSGGSITDSTMLNDLKSDLVVTASYNDGTTATVTNYTLSGNLVIGDNTIVVSYGGFTDNFIVTMTSNLLYKWDLTKSLTDEVSGQVAVASAGSGVDAPAITSNGLVFNAATQMLLLGDIWLTNKTIEIDVVSMDFNGSSDAHIRFLCTMLATGTTGIGPIVYHKTDGWKAYVKTTGTTPAWTNVWTSNKNKNLFDGKTVKLVSGDSDTKLFLNDELVGTLPHFTYEYGSYQPALSIGGCASYSQTAGDQCYDMTISGVRIRSNPTEEVSE